MAMPNQTNELVTLNPHTNSDRDIPDAATFNLQELTQLIEDSAHLVDWENNKHVLSIKLKTLPSYELVDSEGNEWESDEAWEQIVTDVNKDSATMIFEHRQTGDELFFVFSLKN